MAKNGLNKPKSKLPDAFLWIAIALPSIVLVALNIHFSFHPDQDFLMILLQGLLGMLWLFVIGMLILFTLWYKLPKKTILLILSLIVYLWIVPTLLRWFPIGDYVHLAVSFSEYKSKIDNSPNRRLKFDWGSFGGFTAGQGAVRTLVYDPSDKLPKENRIKGTELRKKTCRYNGDACWALTTKQLIGHFYLVTEWH